MILADTNVFTIASFYRGDRSYEASKRFVERIPELGVSITVHNLFEICGIASFHLKQSELEQWFYHFDELYEVEILYPTNLHGTAEQYFSGFVDDLFTFLSRGMAYHDAEVLSIAEKYCVSHFVTWNKKHFEGRTRIPVSTPAEFLRAVA